MNTCKSGNTRASLKKMRSSNRITRKNKKQYPQFSEGYIRRMTDPLLFVPITDPAMIEKLNKKFGPTLTDDERWDIFTKQKPGTRTCV